MRSYNIFGIFLAYSILSASTALGAEDLTPLVNGEYAKTKSEIQSKVTELRKRIAGLESERKQVIEKIIAKNKSEANATELMQKYQLLLTSRYINESGVYQAGLEIKAADRENINKLFLNYLNTTPLADKVSAGQAQRTLSWGIDRLKDLQKVSGDPSPKNHPELEIIAWQMRESEESIKQFTEVAKRIHFELDQSTTHTAGQTSGSGDRAPAHASPR